MTPPLFPGSAHLDTQVFLDSPRSLQGEPNAMVLDAIIKTEESAQNRTLVLSAFVYKDKDEDCAFIPGLYDIFASVCFAFTTRTVTSLMAENFRLSPSSRILMRKVPFIWIRNSL
jgi:hypothetical protein